MVLFWPWRSDNSSPASFEKELSTQSTKISKSQQQLDSLHQSSRRAQALWTLYTSFAYLLCAIILVLVVGWKNWGAEGYSAIAGGPLLIYLIRSGIASYYKFRIESVRLRLEEQQRERAKTIDRLKAATKYNSTQQLLEKYGGGSPQTSAKSKPKGRGSKPPKNQEPPQRTRLNPPATANIPQNQPKNIPQNQQKAPIPMPQPPAPNYPSPVPLPSSPLTNTQPGAPEFAPNAFPALPVYDHSESTINGKWYDRLLDLLMGEDETSPRNRIILICQNCRLVNGQAPPGVKRLQDLGYWRCIACGGSNGIEDEGAKAIKEIKKLAEDETGERPLTEDTNNENIRSQEHSDAEELLDDSPTE